MRRGLLLLLVVLLAACSEPLVADSTVLQKQGYSVQRWTTTLYRGEASEDAYVCLMLAEDSICRIEHFH